MGDQETAAEVQAEFDEDQTPDELGGATNDFVRAIVAVNKIARGKVETKSEKLARSYNLGLAKLHLETCWSDYKRTVREAVKVKEPKPASK